MPWTRRTSRRPPRRRRRQEQAQPNQQASHQDVQPTPPAQTAQAAQPAQPAQAQPTQPSENRQPVHMAALEPQAAQPEPASDDAPLPASWINSPLMTASIGFDTIPSAARLSDREIATLKARLQECWTPPRGLAEADAQKLVVVLRVSLQRNGALAEEPTLLAASASPKGRRAVANGHAGSAEVSAVRLSAGSKIQGMEETRSGLFACRPQFSADTLKST